MRELTRIANEDMSPLANETAVGSMNEPTGRYVLLHLLGKGGFSEVCVDSDSTLRNIFL